MQHPWCSLIIPRLGVLLDFNGYTSKKAPIGNIMIIPFVFLKYAKNFRIIGETISYIMDIPLEIPNWKRRFMLFSIRLSSLVTLKNGILLF